jgi:carboxyl-terminal processing protease
MKKRLLAVFLACCLLLAAAPVSFAYTAEEQRDLVYDLIDFLNKSALEGSETDDPLRTALAGLFQDDPAAYQLLMSRLLSQYDSHTMYVPEGVYSTAFPTNSDYVGIGVTIQQDAAGALVADLNRKAPAYLAGMRTGDVITAVDGAALAGKTTEEISALLRGARNTWVTVSVRRAGKTLSFKLLRVSIGDANFTGYLLEDGVYYMKWARLSTLTSFVQFTAAVKDMCAQGARSLILDLRGDPGGELDLGFNVVDRLLPDKTDFFKVGWREGTEMKYQTISASGQGPRLNQIVVLVDGESASASEIILCGLTDTGYAVSVGDKTYGKARAQYHIPLENNAAAVVTVYKLCSLTRPDYEGVGITPDYWISNEYGAPAAAAAARVPEKALPLGNCSDNAATLNAALQALDYLGRQEKPYLFSQDTQLALQRLCYDHGVTPAAAGMTAAMAKLVNRCLEERTLTDSGIVDWQMDKALELARAAAKQPAQYHLDALGNIVNDPKK